MLYTSRPYHAQLDRDRLTELLLAYRLAGDVRLYPTIWRVRLLLSSRVWEPEHDTRLWEDRLGQLAGFAMLWRRRPDSPYLVLDPFFHPAFLSGELVNEMTGWGVERADAIALQQKGPLTLYAADFPQRLYPDSPYPGLGFAPIAPNPQEHDLYFVRSLPAEPPAPLLPPGFAIQTLKRAEDLEAYQALYGFAKVNPEHQRELLSSDEYAHLVLSDPGGNYVAYCECSTWRAEWQGGRPKSGWIDYIETHPEHQRRGLGRAILSAGLARLREWGADSARLVTITTNTPAVQLYHSAGFEIEALVEPQTYEKQIKTE